ncbi:MAG: HD domain-containing protein [Thermoanaerobaculaceae bacterium]|nr:HD domain-containing protein [Thermoanaerobaculaceae bacterium]
MDFGNAVSRVGFIAGLSTAIDLMDPALHLHHRWVAVLAGRIGQAMGLSDAEVRTLMLAGLLHDIGALSLTERLALMRFEEPSERSPGHAQHGEVGYQLLRGFGPLREVARAIRFHHVEWRPGRGHGERGVGVPAASHILHLADRLAVVLGPGTDLLQQASRVSRVIRLQRGEVFAPAPVDALLDVAARTGFWLETRDSVETDSWLDRWKDLPSEAVELGPLAELFCRLIDFRSRFTSTHTSGVAAMCKAIGDLCGLPGDRVEALEVAGHLHDLGKVSVPVEFLEKPGALTAPQYLRVQAHSYETYRILRASGVPEDIVAWASYHHERIDGRGYPFHLGGESLSLESRIVAVADVFTALTEDRPYRTGMDAAAVVRILRRMGGGALDADLTALVGAHAADLNAERAQAQGRAKIAYESFLGRIGPATC